MTYLLLLSLTTGTPLLFFATPFSSAMSTLLSRRVRGVGPFPSIATRFIVGDLHKDFTVAESWGSAPLSSALADKDLTVADTSKARRLPATNSPPTRRQLAVYSPSTRRLLAVYSPSTRRGYPAASSVFLMHLLRLFMPFFRPFYAFLALFSCKRPKKGGLPVGELSISGDEDIRRRGYLSAGSLVLTTFSRTFMLELSLLPVPALPCAGTDRTICFSNSIKITNNRPTTCFALLVGRRIGSMDRNDEYQGQSSASAEHFDEGLGDGWIENYVNLLHSQDPLGIADQYRDDQNLADEEIVDQHRDDQHIADQHIVDENHADQMPADQYFADQNLADQVNNQNNVLPGQWQPPLTTEVINSRRDAVNQHFVPIFHNPQQAVESYDNWLQSRNQDIAPGSNDQRLNMLGPDTQDLVRRLYEAFRNVEGAYEGRDAQGQFSKAVSKAVLDTPNLDVEILLSVLLKKIESSQEGKNEFPPTYGDKPYQAYDSFTQRFEAVEEVLKSSKLVCKNIITNQDWLFRLAWNPDAELKRKNQNLVGNHRRDQQNKVGAQIMKDGIVEVADDGKVFLDHNGQKKELNLEANRKSSAPLQDFMDQRVPTRGGQTATAAAQKSLGLSRKRTQTQQKNPSAKRTRTSNTPSQAGSPAPATPAAQAAALASPAMQYPDIDQQLLAAPEVQAAAVSAPDAQFPVAPAAAASPGPQPRQRRRRPLARRPRMEHVDEAQDDMAGLFNPGEIEEAPQNLQPQGYYPQDYYPQVAPNQQPFAQRYGNNTYPVDLDNHDPRFDFDPEDIPQAMHSMYAAPSPRRYAPRANYPAPAQFGHNPNDIAWHLDHLDDWESVPNNANTHWQNSLRSQANVPFPSNGGGHVADPGSSAAQTPPEDNASQSQGNANGNQAAQQLAFEMRGPLY
ncbi:hypothetical protein PG985_003671 [Apiospora marii]|uniref:uncharacterized protein n=1 Tax=Apiospora marii TaxID=335849 RepID=UPI00312F7C88